MRAACSLALAAADRERLLMDSGWQFALGHASDQHKDFDYATLLFSFAKAGYGDGPVSPKFDDRTWRTLDLPHDWAVELPFDAKGDGNHGFKAIGRYFPENSVGWYRKTFTIPKEDFGRRIGIEFDGVFRDSCLGKRFYLGAERSGYSGFHYDMTNYLNYGGANVLVVRVNATLGEGGFTRSGHLPPCVADQDGDSPRGARWHLRHVDGRRPGAGHPEVEVTALVTVENDGDKDARFTLEEEIENADGKIVASSPRLPAAFQPQAAAIYPWRSQYTMRSFGRSKHRISTSCRHDPQRGQGGRPLRDGFGIRSIRFDPNQGFFLNGKHVEIKGTDEHQDHAGVGVAVPDALSAFRLARLKELGSNAIRTSHNPPTPELLEACDRMGVLVLDETGSWARRPKTTTT